MSPSPRNGDRRQPPQEHLAESNVSDNSNNIECAADAGLHGVSDSSTRKFAANGSKGPWSGSSDDKISWSTGEPITFYSGNYLNWRASPNVTLTRLLIMRNTLSTLLDNLEDNVNVGLMRYSNDRNTLPNASDGGMVVVAMGKIEDNRAGMKTALSGWVPSGSTPLSETLL